MLRHVLVIDDARDAHDLVANALRSDEIEVRSAYDGQTGLRMAIQEPPDLILLDVTLPDIDGWELCDLLGVQEATCRTPVIFLTASADGDSLTRGLEHGAWDYICKPVDPAELRARVRTAIRYGYYLQTEAKRAMVDALTGLWNRRYFDQRLSAELASCERHGRLLSCIIADIDHFKRLNDAHGHAAGDDVIRVVAEVLRAGCRGEDVISRYGGEEFAVLCPDVNGVGAAVLAERLRADVAIAPLMIPDARVTCSFGVADYSGGGADLVSRADAALYRAKRAGRNRVDYEFVAQPAK
jgi:diguanylate cyclase (GGDEF)-like protein